MALANLETRGWTRHPASMVLLSLACTAAPCPAAFERREDGNCYPQGSPSGEDSPRGETGLDSEAWVPELELGDPLEALTGTAHDGWEFLDGAILEDGRLLAMGQGGWMLADPATGESLATGGLERVYRMDLDGDRVYAASRTGAITKLDLSSGTPQKSASKTLTEGYHEDISADGGLVLVGAQEEGALLLDDQLNLLAKVPATFAGGVALIGEVALVTDDDELVLLDLGSASPSELDRLPLRGRGRDIAFDGHHVAVAMGSEGVDVFEVQGDRLGYRGALDMPGSAFNVTLDGDMLYVAAWEVIVAAWLGGEEPVVLGHEQPIQSAWAVAARDGTLTVLDWGWLTPLKLNEGVAGPELHPPNQIWVSPGSTETLAVELTNYGAFDLELELPDQDVVSASPSSMTLAPGASGVFSLTPVAPWKGSSDVRLLTNDPDEQSSRLSLRETEGSIGAAHPEMVLEGFVPPSASTERFDLADYRGRPVFIAYFTTW